MIYFDNSATTMIHPEVVEAMLPYLKEEFGNPSGKYYRAAENARKAVENAREQVAKLLGCQTDEVVFTSGTSESNNMVLKGMIDPLQRMDAHFVTTKTEHPSILETAKYLQSRGCNVTFLEVDRFGRVRLEQLKDVLDQKPTLVSVIWGNNEIGSLNPIREIANLCESMGVPFHTDATQVVGKLQVNMEVDRIRFLSCSAHKIHGPKGIGACVIRKNELGIRTKLTPLIHGGGQEGDYRSGTLSVHNIVGFGKAAEIALKDLVKTSNHLRQLEEVLVDRLKSLFPGVVHFNSDTKDKVPGIVNVRFSGVNNELLLKKLADRVAMSTGSACSSGKPSHVLESIGLQLDQIRQSVRISLSRYNTLDEVEAFLAILQGG